MLWQDAGVVVFFRPWLRRDRTTTQQQLRRMSFRSTVCGKSTGSGTGNTGVPSFFSPDVIPNGWLGSQHQLTNWLPSCSLLCVAPSRVQVDTVKSSEGKAFQFSYFWTKTCPEITEMRGKSTSGYFYHFVCGRISPYKKFVMAQVCRYVWQTNIRI